MELPEHAPVGSALRDYLHLDALSLATGLGLPPVAGNLIILGFAAGKRLLFCQEDLLEGIIRDKSQERFREGNLRAFREGSQAAAL